MSKVYHPTTPHRSAGTRPVTGDAKLRNRPFVGRIGGNQQFTVSPDDPEYEKIKDETPDAVADITWGKLCNLGGFREPEIWRSGLIELWVSGLNSFASGAVGIALGNSGIVSSSVVAPAIAGVTVALILPLLILAAAPSSGGHFNPMITMATFVTRLSTLPRTVVYVIAQTLGATIGAYLLRAGLGDETVASAIIPGCNWDSNTITDGQAFVLETVSCCVMLFIAFGVGLDPRQSQVFGPALGPIFIGFALGLLTFVTGIMKTGYTGASMNPARCFGLLSATGTWGSHWIQWVGPIVALIVNGVLYWVAPPYHSKTKIIKKTPAPSFTSSTPDSQV